jgi:hypothetical protein
LFNDLTAQVAFLQAIYRGDAGFIERLSELIKKKITMEESDKGVIGTGARVIHCGSIRNVNIGPAAFIHGSSLLENGTVLSCREHPTEIGENVQAVSFIVSEGAEVTGGAVLNTVFVGQVRISEGSTLQKIPCFLPIVKDFTVKPSRFSAVLTQ